MPEIAFAVLFMCVLIAVMNWQSGFFMCVVVALLQDPMRKLTPGQPIYFLLFVGLVFAATWGAALASKVPLAPQKVYGWSAIRLAATIFYLILFAQAMHSSVRWDSFALPALGLLFYTAPVPAIILSYQFAVRGGFVRVQKLMWFYVAISIPWLTAVWFDYSGQTWAVLGEVGVGQFIYDVGGRFRLPAGLYRAAEIAAWHVATTSAFLFLLLRGRRLSPFKIFITLVVVAFLVAIGILTGRRKLLVNIAVFLSMFFFFRIWFVSQSTKWAVLTMVAGSVFALSIVGVVAPEDGERSFDSPSIVVKTDKYSALIKRGESVWTDIPERLSLLGLGSAQVAVSQFGVFGAGLGTGSQGSQHLGGGAARFGYAAEGGMGKLTLELGIPGLLAALWLVFAFVRHINTNLILVTRTSIAHANFAFGLAAFLVANVASFMLATQAYGDLFVLLLLGWALGFLLAMPVVAEQARLRAQATGQNTARPAGMASAAPFPQVRS